MVSRLPIFAILIILKRLASSSFQDFFYFFMTWSATQSRSTITNMLNSYPITELYTWGNIHNMINRDMFLYFIDIAGSLQNKDALFYKSFGIVLQRNTGAYNQFNDAYETLLLLANNDHNLSTLVVKVLDIYYFPKKRDDAIADLSQMTDTPGKEKQITQMIHFLKIIVKNFGQVEIFTELFGQPICQQHNSAKPKYVPDGMVVQPSCISHYECQQCKAAVIVACFAGFGTSITI